jgi:hypothetical protein
MSDIIAETNPDNTIGRNALMPKPVGAARHTFQEFAIGYPLVIQNDGGRFRLARGMCLKSSVR